MKKKIIETSNAFLKKFLNTIIIFIRNRSLRAILLTKLF